MPRLPKYAIKFAPETIDHLDVINRKYQRLIEKTIDEQIASLADVKARLSAYVDEAETEGPVIITRNEKAVAVLLAPVDDEDLEQLVLSRSPRFQALLNKSRQSIKAGKGLSRDEFWQAVERARPNR